MVEQQGVIAPSKPPQDEPKPVRSSKRIKPAKRKPGKRKPAKRKPIPTKKAAAPKPAKRKPIPAKKPTKKAARSSRKPQQVDADITLDIERGNRMAIRWPTELEPMTKALTYDVKRAVGEDDAPVAIVGNLIGKIEHLKDGVSKKLTPLNFINAHQVLDFIKTFGLVKNPITGEPQYRTWVSPEFGAWFKGEAKAKKLAGEAHKLLEYREEYDKRTLHQRWPDATSVIERTPKGEVYKIGFPDINVPLYPWQAVGMQFTNVATRQGKGVFICDETGLGKTYTVLAHLKRQRFKAVVVCPATLIEGWMRKIQHAIAEEADPNDPDKYRATAIKADKDMPLDADKYDIIVMSYSMLKRKGIYPIAKYIEEQQRVLVLDESHYSKNYASRRTSVCLAMSLGARHSIVMTATPLKNRILELHPQLRITRRLWTEASLVDFARMYATEEARVEIAEKLEGIMVRRMAKDVWKNPPQQQINEAWVELSNRDDYAAVERDFIKWLMSQGASDEKLASAERGKALVKLNKLRALSAAGKVEETIKMLDKTLSAGEQCIIFCAFNDPLKKIARHFTGKQGLNYKGQRWKGSGLIIGEVPHKRRQVLIDSFMAGKTGLLCIGTGAGGLGIDLPIAAYGYFLDLPWTPADIEQGTGRLMRLGQERDCTFVKILAPRTIDQRMEELIQVKAEIFRDAIGDEEAVERVTTSNVMRESMVSAIISGYMRDAI